MARQYTGQFSVLQIIIVISVAALALTAMTQTKSTFVYSVFSFVTLIAFLCACLFAIFCRGIKRAYWVGFLVWGGGYIVWSECLEVKDGFLEMLTTRVLRSIYSLITEPNTWSNQTNQWVEGVVDFDIFFAGGQLLFTWVFAGIGGWLAILCCQNRESSENETTEF